MAKILTRLRIDEVSAVDRGAGENVKIMLMKRGRDKAKELSMGKFIEFFRGQKPASEVLAKSTAALAESIGTIVGGDLAPEKRKALSETFAEFDDYVQKNVTASPAPDKNGDTAMFKDLAKSLGLKEDASQEDILKAINDRDAEIAFLKADLLPEEKEFLDTLKSRPAKPTAGAAGKPIDGMKEGGVGGDSIEDDDDALDQKGTGGVVQPYSRPRADGRSRSTAPLDKQAFLKMTHEERKRHMRKSEDLPEWVQKTIDEAAELRKRVENMENEKELQKFEKMAKEHELPPTDAPKLMKLSKADPDALSVLLKRIKGDAAALKAAGTFSELGASGGNGGNASAYDELMAKAAEIRKADPKLTEAQAFEKAFMDPANKEIAKRERMESVAPVMMPPGSMR
jgi:hypothetical protein